MVQVPSPKRHPYAQWAPDARALDLVGDKWTLLIVRDLLAGPRRFVELQRVLPGISTEQLRSRLNRMVADGMLTRKRYREVPPRVDYELTERARDLVPILAELAHWGYRWAWSAPRNDERVDIGAIFRLAAGLIETDGPKRTVALEVTDGSRDGEAAHYAISLGGGQRASLAEEPTEDADARLSGDIASWVLALSPACDLSSLKVSGDRQLAERLVTSLGAYDVQAEEPGASADRQVA